MEVIFRIDEILRDETVVGKKLVVEKNGLFKRKLHLKNVTYCGLLSELMEAQMKLVKIHFTTIFAL